VIEEKTKELDDLKLLQQQKVQQSIEIKFSQRYKQVKFFERRKLMRKINGIKKKLENLKNNVGNNENEEEEQMKIQHLESQVEKDLENLLYVTHYPRDVKYISLFPREPMTDEKSIENRKKLKELIIARYGYKIRENKNIDGNFKVSMKDLNTIKNEHDEIDEEDTHDDEGGPPENEIKEDDFFQSD